MTSGTYDRIAGKRRLVFIWNYRNWGGAQIYLLAIMKHARERWDVLAVLPEGTSADMIGFLEQAGISYTYTKAEVDVSEDRSLQTRVQRHKLRFLAELRTLKLIRGLDLERTAIHVEFAPWQSWIFYTLASRLGACIFVTMHNALPEKPAWRVLVWKARLQLVSRLQGFHLFTANRDAKAKLKGMVADSFWDRIRVTPAGIDPTQIEEALSMPLDREATLARHGIAKDALVVLCVGQFIDRKGRWTFLEAAAKVAGDQYGPTFVWVAPQELSENELRQIESFGLGDKFKFLLSKNVGTTRTEVLSFFRIAEIFALPSRLEGLPIALLEAMAMGIASISTNVNAIPEALIDRVTGISIAPDDPDALAAAVLKLANNEEERRRLASAGREFVLTNFDERVGSRIAIAEYEGCINVSA